MTSKVLIFLAALLILILIPHRSLAESFSKYGIGLFQSAQDRASETRMISLGFRDDLFGPFVYHYEAGLWIDSTGKGRNSSAFFDAEMGVEVVSGDLVLRSTHGLAFISTPDAYIGGTFPNFVHDIYVGIRGKSGNAIGLNYKHLSNAGLMPPNIGRDFISIDVGIPW